MADSYPGLSPYCYTTNNPLKFTDADGREVGVPILVGIGAGEVAVGVTIAVGATLSVVGADDMAKAVKASGDWIDENINKPLINLIPALRGGEPTHFPITQDDGITQTTISPADATKVPIKFESGEEKGQPIEAKLKGGKTGVVGVHVSPEGSVHIQPYGKGQTHHDGVVIDPSKPIPGQVKKIIKGPKSAFDKAE